MKRNLVSVIIPAYQCEKWISRCLKSIMEQTYGNLEIIIINDGSVDNTGSICDNYSKKDKRIKVIHQQNLGASKARNIGIDNAKGKYIYFVDADDYIEKECIEKLVSGMLYGQITICQFYNDTTTINKKNIEKKANTIIKCTREDIFKRMLNPKCDCEDICYGYLWNKIFIKDIIQKENIHFSSDCIMWEDMLFCCKYVNVIKSGIYIYEKLYHYNTKNQHSMSHKLSSNSVDSWKRAAEEIQKIILKNNLSKITDYNSVLADIYMKTIIAYAKEKKISTVDKKIISFISNKKIYLKKYYKCYYILFKFSPLLFERVSFILKY